ncbi:MAG: hypothetical protein ACI90V_012297, partial [Bacillariaceae sp.]
VVIIAASSPSFVKDAVNDVILEQVKKAADAAKARECPNKWDYCVLQLPIMEERLGNNPAVDSVV